jgi:hypothetical protein
VGENWIDEVKSGGWEALLFSFKRCTQLHPARHIYNPLPAPDLGRSGILTRFKSQIVPLAYIYGHHTLFLIVQYREIASCPVVGEGEGEEKAGAVARVRVEAGIGGADDRGR